MPSIVRDKQKPLRALYKAEPARALKTYRVRSVIGPLEDPFAAAAHSALSVTIAPASP